MEEFGKIVLAATLTAAAKDADATADDLIAYARQLEDDGRLVDTPSLREKQADAPGATGPYFRSSTQEESE